MRAWGYGGLCPNLLLCLTHITLIYPPLPEPHPLSSRILLSLSSTQLFSATMSFLWNSLIFFAAISTASFQGRSFSIHDESLTAADTDEEPMSLREYPLIVFRTKFDYKHNSPKKASINDKSPLVCRSQSGSESYINNCEATHGTGTRGWEIIRELR